MLSFQQTGNTTQKGLWAEGECVNSILYQYEKLSLSFYSFGEPERGTYNTTNDPIQIAGYRILMSNDTASITIAIKTFDVYEYTKPYERIELKIDLSDYKGLHPGEWTVTVMLTPHNTTKYPRDILKFELSLVQEVQGKELINTILFFVVPFFYVIIIYYVNRFVNKRVPENISIIAWLTLKTWFMLFKIFAIWLFFVSNSEKTLKKKKKELRKKAKKRDLHVRHKSKITS